MRYEINYLAYMSVHKHSYTNDLQEALQLAKELDDELWNGDNGISFIRDTTTQKDAMVGSHNFQGNNVTELAWVDYYEIRLEKHLNKENNPSPPHPLGLDKGVTKKIAGIYYLWEGR